MVVSGSSRGAPLWKKGPTIEKRQPITKELSDQGGSVLNFGKVAIKDNSATDVTTMDAEINKCGLL